MKNKFTYDIKNKTDLYEQMLKCPCDEKLIRPLPLTSNNKDDYIFNIENANCILLKQTIQSINPFDYYRYRMCKTCIYPLFFPNNIWSSWGYNNIESFIIKYKNDYYRKFNEEYKDNMTPSERTSFLHKYNMTSCKLPSL